MYSIQIYKLNSKSFTTIKYEKNDETLESIMTKYDKNLNLENTRLSIGKS